ncbi:MAG: DUF86 domain-containing protein [Thermoanaerobaculia bacterium]|nr:DUF86 domain-containing protein [Thermoanaerobaculia bacterium]
MPPRSWQLRITDILGAIERIERYTSGMTREQFVNDPKTLEAVCFALVVIGEAAGHLPEEVQASAPDVPWRQMRSMRNLAAHEYFGIDAETVWETATNDVPRLRASLEPLLER